MTSRLLAFTAVGGLCIGVASCTHHESGTPGQRAEQLPLLDYAEMVRKDAPASLIDEHVIPGIRALKDRKLALASRSFNRALKLDPTSSGAHFLNGLTYHLMAAEGDSSQLDYAEIGYEMALRFDPANAWAAYQLGVIHFGNRAFGRAQDRFAYAARYLPGNAEILIGLAASSYYARDLVTARAAVEKLLELAPDNPGALRAAAMVYSASDEFNQALALAERYTRTPEGESVRGQRLVGRVGEWMSTHNAGRHWLASVTTSDVLGDDATTEGLSPKSDRGYSDYADKDKAAQPDAKALPRMALVDVVIIRSEERSSTIKGVNLLSGLQLQFSGTLLSQTWNRSFDSTKDPARTRNWSNSVSLSFPAVTYSLNIFNDNVDLNEVLARPTLVATDGKKSEFFSGAVWHVELSGSSSSYYSSVSDVPVGIRLTVTPQFLNDETVLLDVTAARAFVESRAAEAGFNNFAQTSKTSVTANVVMRFDQTLVLSGLSEKETEEVKDGVPLLQDIPLVQYFFSNETTLDFNKSVLILLTPRKPQYTYVNGVPVPTTARAEEADPPPSAIDELKTRSDWNFAPGRNLDAVMRHLDEATFVKEFRTGDVTLEKWDRTDSLEYKIRKALGFIWY